MNLILVKLLSHFGNIKDEHYYYDWNIYEGIRPPWTETEYSSQITQVEFVNEIVPKYTSCWFYNCRNLTNVNINNLNTSKVTDMSNMFYNCGALTSLDLSNFDTSNVTNMEAMLYSCIRLPNLNVSNFDTSNVTNMSNMFTNCYALTNLDLSNFDTNAVQNYSYMFLNDYDTQVYIGDNWNSAMTESATSYSKTFIKK